LLVQDGAHLAQAHVIGSAAVQSLRATALLDRPACRLDPRFGSDAVGDAVQPAAQRLLFANGCGRACQDEERGLQRVLGIVLMAQHTAADREDHLAVPLDHGSKRGLIVLGDKAL